MAEDQGSGTPSYEVSAFVQPDGANDILQSLSQALSINVDGLSDDSKEETSPARFEVTQATFDAFRESSRRRIDLFEESNKKLSEFKALLVKFSKTLADRKVDAKLDITLKEPEAYTMDDVILIATKLLEKNQHSRQVHTWTDTIKNFFRAAAGETGVLKTMLSFVPNDAYGAVIYGGFTVILTALYRYDALKTEIYAALAEIPYKLECIDELRDIHSDSPSLCQAADQVFVAIFRVLERVVEELSKSTSRKILGVATRGDKYGDSITTAAKALEQKVKIFVDKASRCDARRMKRIDEGVQNTALGIQNNMLGLQHVNRSLLKLTQALCRKADIATVERKEVMLFRESTSTNGNSINVSFAVAEAASGRGESSKSRKLLDASKIPRTISPAPGLDAVHDYAPRSTQDIVTNKGRMTAKRWIKTLDRPFHHHAANDVQTSVEFHLSPEELDRVRWILSSDSIQQWLQLRKSQTLVIQSMTAPDTIVNALSFCTGLLVHFMREVFKNPIIYYSCGLHSERSRSEVESGPMALLNSINAQLMRDLMDKVVNLSQLDQYANAESQHDIKQGLRLFKYLVWFYPEHYSIFIFVDSLSRLSGSDPDCEAVIGGVQKIMKCNNVSVKLLLTDVMPTAKLKGDVIWLYVQDDVDGGAYGMDVSVLWEDTRKTMKKSCAKKNPRASTSEDDSEDSVVVSDTSSEDGI